MRIGSLEIVDPGLEARIVRIKDPRYEIGDMELSDTFNYLICYGLLWRMGPDWVATGVDLIRSGYCILPCAGRC